MDALPYDEETHNYSEGLLVMTGQMMLAVHGERFAVDAGQMYLIEAGVPHSVLSGSHGTLVIIQID